MTLAKPLPKGGAPPPSKEHFRKLEGLDTVAALFPNKLVQPLNFAVEEVEVVQASGLQIDKEAMNCPRCGKPVQGKNGICNNCGENALQCTYCRNINYEKLDAFICNECGLSRYCKFEIQFVCKSGFATERIESEEMKQSASTQIEQHLSSA
mmetsp:Transcript_21654/g.15906  ORF Transcript_21654/g.15906 Transcript_21654/m.15906 type:complete len:152 (+) Transcript_21654:55-510(+)